VVAGRIRSPGKFMMSTAFLGLRHCLPLDQYYDNISSQSKKQIGSISSSADASCMELLASPPISGAEAIEDL